MEKIFITRKRNKLFLVKDLRKNKHNSKAADEEKADGAVFSEIYLQNRHMEYKKTISALVPKEMDRYKIEVLGLSEVRWNTISTRVIQLATP